MKRIDIISIILRGLTITLIVILGFFLYYEIKVDNVSPEFYLKGDSNITIEAGDEFKDPGFVARFNKVNYKDLVRVESNLNNEVPGEYYIRYSLNYKNIKLGKPIVRKIYVKDTKNPTILIDGDRDISIPLNSNFETPTYKADDNVDGDITDKVEIESNLNTNKEGEYDIKYKVSDTSNNKAEEVVHVTVSGKNAYIEISIANQTLNYYEYNKLVLSSDVVTGLHDGTPRGEFSVLNKTMNATLKGADYTSFVKYWIAFKGHSYGMHDASWRNTFGGNIYKYNGSHGCVNMPYTKVQQLYNMVEIGTPVYIN